jgi:nitrate reductase beta subunit
MRVAQAIELAHSTPNLKKEEELTFEYEELTSEESSKSSGEARPAKYLKSGSD